MFTRIFQLYKRYDIRCDALHLDTCCGLAIAAHGDKAIVLVFRGTTSFLQLIEEADKSVLNKHASFFSNFPNENEDLLISHENQ